MPGFRRLGFLYVPYLIARHIRAQLGLFVVLVGVAALVYGHFQHLNPVASVYAGVSTITTIGLYAPYPLPDQEMVILIVLIVLSVGILASTVQTMMGTIANREVWVTAKSRWAASQMRNHTVVCGDGDILVSVCKKLQSMRREYVVVTNNADLKKKLGQDVPVIVDDPRSHESLLAAGIKAAKAVVIAFDDDATSLVVTLNAEQFNPKATKVVSVKSTELIDHFKQAGADVVIPISSVAGRVMAASTVSPNIGGVIFSDTIRGEGDLELAVFEVEPSSQASASKVSLIDRAAITLAIIREHKIITYFKEDDELRVGDRLLLLGNHEQFETVSKLVGGRPEEIKQID